MQSFTSAPRRLLLLLPLLLASLPAIPQQTSRYTVEIVVFRNDTPGAEDVAAAASLHSSTADLEYATAGTRKLAGAAGRLRSAGYRIIAHTAWSQGAAAWNSRRGVSAEQLGIDGAGVSGNVVVERGQYLHLGFDLTVEDGGRSYRIAEIRTVKLNEAQYFDHPQVGVIALLTAGS